MLRGELFPSFLSFFDSFSRILLPCTPINLIFVFVCLTRFIFVVKGSVTLTDVSGVVHKLKVLIDVKIICLT